MLSTSDAGVALFSASEIGPLGIALWKVSGDCFRDLPFFLLVFHFDTNLRTQS
jgi:hypothetical protein